MCTHNLRLSKNKKNIKNYVQKIFNFCISKTSTDIAWTSFRNIRAIQIQKKRSVNNLTLVKWIKLFEMVKIYLAFDLTDNQNTEQCDGN